jgi:4-amino-4-deoxy-L-arabinose transferase-like glycosyltransferase
MRATGAAASKGHTARMSQVNAGQVAAQAKATAPAVPAPLCDRRQLVAWYAAFGAFAVLVFATCGEPLQWIWAIWAAGGYVLAALAAALWQSRGREASLVIALAGALAAPLAWQVTFGRTMPRAGEDSLTVLARSAAQLLQHGTPYLPADQISHVLQYNPYEPAMAIFGLPAAVGLHGVAGDPRLWMGITTAAVLAAAFRLAQRGSAMRCTVFAFGSPVLALPLTQGLTDPPVLALLCLALACAGAPQRRRGELAAGIALGAACAIKATAWPALPVLAAMLAVRHDSRAAIRFVATAVVATTTLVVAAAPASLTSPAALFENTVLFPLGMARYQTEADSPLPGHLIAATGSAGRWAAIGLLCAVALALGVWLIVQPPTDTKAAAWRLAVTLAMLFTLAPASRWGYFVYPAALLGFVRITSMADGPRGALQPHREQQERPGVQLTSVTWTSRVGRRLANEPVGRLAGSEHGMQTRAHVQPAAGLDGQLAPVAPVIADA